jgi:hypothetical protein
MRTKVVIINPSQTIRGMFKDYVFSKSLFLDVIEVGFHDQVLEILNQEANRVILIILGNLGNSKIQHEAFIKYIQNHEYLYFIPLVMILDYHAYMSELFHEIFLDQDLLHSIQTNSGNFAVMRKPFIDDDFCEAVKLALERRLLKKRYPF